jgi:sugar lactone lactonase YvrE
MASAMSFAPAAFGAFVPSPGDLLVVDRTAQGGAVLVVERQTGAVSVVTAGNALVDPRRVAVADDGMLFVVDAGSQGEGTVVRVDPRDGSQTVVVPSGLLAATGIALAPGGFAFVTQGAMGTLPLVRVTLADGTVTPVITGSQLMAPVDLARESAGTLVVADTGFGGGDVLRVDPATQGVAMLDAGVFRPLAIALEADGSILVAGGATAASTGVYRLGKTATAVSTGGQLVAPMGIAVAPFATIFVADLGIGTGAGAVVAVDPETGAQTTVASGAAFATPNGIAVVTRGAAACGNGILDAGEACDQGDGNGGPSACCDVDCRLAVADVPCPAESNFCGTQADGVACTPDDPCVTGAACRDGACAGGTATCDAGAIQGEKRNAAGQLKRRRPVVTVDCRVDGDPRQPCVAQGFFASSPVADAAAAPADCAVPGTPVTAAVRKLTNRQNRRRFNVPLRACAKRRLKKSGSLDVNMVMRMGDGDDRRTVLRRIRLMKAGPVRAGS